jgi:hypothetical protein
VCRETRGVQPPSCESLETIKVYRLSCGVEVCEVCCGARRALLSSEKNVRVSVRLCVWPGGLFPLQYAKRNYTTQRENPKPASGGVLSQPPWRCRAQTSKLGLFGGSAFCSRCWPLGLGLGLGFATRLGLGLAAALGPALLERPQILILVL